jgi:transposase-like protein
MRSRPRPAPVPQSAFTGFRFSPDVIVLAVRWYLRFGLSYRDVEELLAERGVEVDHVTVYRWVLRFTPLLAEAARPCRHLVGGPLVRGRDLREGRRPVALRLPRDRPVRPGHRRVRLCSPRRQGRPPVLRAGHRTTKVAPVEVVTDRAATYPMVLEELLPAPWHRTEQDANNRVEGDHGRLKARLRPMRGLKQDRNARVVVVGHAFVQNVRRGHYELATEEPANRRLAVAFDELAMAI